MIYNIWILNLVSVAYEINIFRPIYYTGKHQNSARHIKVASFYWLFILHTVGAHSPKMVALIEFIVNIIFTLCPFEHSYTNADRPKIF